jgi:uncharacterized protein YggE
MCAHVKEPAMRTALVLALAFGLGATALASSRPLTAEQPAPTPVGIPQPQPTLTVSADAHVQTAPDLATVRLGVFAQEKDAAAAQSKVNDALGKIITAIRGQGVAAEQIQTSGLSLSPLYTNPRPRQNGETEEARIYAYRADSTVSVRVKDLKRTGAVIDAALTNGANQLQGVSFGLQNETSAKTQALRESAASAKAKANAIADALGVRLVELVEAQEGGANVIRPIFEGYGRAMDMAAPASIAPTPVEPGQIDISASITLRYRISSTEH